MKGNEKLKLEPLYPVLSLKIRFYGYLVGNSQKATLTFTLKSRFSVKPCKFQICFANDGRTLSYVYGGGFFVKIVKLLTIFAKSAEGS